MPRVCIVIPCFNTGIQLHESVCSAVAQTHTDLDIVIVDDGSTDPLTRTLLDSCPWPNVRIIRQDNRGPAAARNVGIHSSDAKYVLPLDADDRFAPTYVEKAVHIAEVAPKIGIVYCRAEKFGAATGEWILPRFSKQEMAVDNVIFVSALFRRADWEKVNGYSESLRHGMEDYDFWIRLIHHGAEVFQINEVLFYYRIHHKSRTTDFLAHRTSMVNTYAEIVQRTPLFFAENASALFQHRFRLYDQIQTLKGQKRRPRVPDVRLVKQLLRRAFKPGS